MESVLQNINKLNRSLEEVIAVGNEFAPTEALWQVDCNMFTQVSSFVAVVVKDSGWPVLRRTLGTKQLDVEFVDFTRIRMCTNESLAQTRLLRVGIYFELLHPYHFFLNLHTFNPKPNQTSTHLIQNLTKPTHTKSKIYQTPTH